MNEEIQPQTTEQSTEQAPPEELSLSEHEAQFPGGSKPAVVVAEDQAPIDETPDEATARETRAADQARDKDTGQFKPGRRRAKSQQAGADDVPRIKELTRQLRERDEELTRLRTPPAPVAGTPITPVGGNGNGHAPAAAPQKQGERFVLPAPPFDPEPSENDPKYGGDFTRYLTEAAKWSARQEVRQNEFDRYVAQQQETQKQAAEKENRDFASRVDASRAKHDDFEEVALEAPTPIQKDTIPDIFIRRDDNGPEVLYYLHAHRQELDELLQMPELGQVKFLTLLSQRLSSNGSGLTGATTSVPGPKTIVLPHPPPKVVRTTAQPAHSGVPTDRELSLSEHEHYYQPTKRR
jgi:hypothetical protein